jgi:hypothetical protein
MIKLVVSCMSQIYHNDEKQHLHRDVEVGLCMYIIFEL